MALCLTAICLVCSALLAGVYALTAEPIAAAAAAIYVIIEKIKAKNAPNGYDEDNYVSCSCLDEDFVSETVAE